LHVAGEYDWLVDRAATGHKRGAIAVDRLHVTYVCYQRLTYAVSFSVAGECDWLVDRAATGHKRGAITAIAAALPQRTRKAVWQFVRSNYTPTEVQVRRDCLLRFCLARDVCQDLVIRWQGVKHGSLCYTPRGCYRYTEYGKNVLLLLLLLRLLKLL
jgi:hypothetical protein